MINFKITYNKKNIIWNQLIRCMKNKWIKTASNFLTPFPSSMAITEIMNLYINWMKKKHNYHVKRFYIFSATIAYNL